VTENRKKQTEIPRSDKYPYSQWHQNLLTKPEDMINICQQFRERPLTGKGFSTLRDFPLFKSHSNVGNLHISSRKKMSIGNIKRKHCILSTA
jgi:hypothetical protein